MHHQDFLVVGLDRFRRLLAEVQFGVHVVLDHRQQSLTQSLLGDDLGDALELGRGDAVAFGRLYITNPDLAERIEARAELAPTDAAHIYDPGPEGYIDFPTRSL